MNIEDIKWEAVKENKRGRRKRTWDVRITLNKSGTESRNMKVRFGFINKAAEVFHAGQYIAMSEPVKDRIYFMTSDEKKDNRFKKIGMSKADLQSLYTSFSPIDRIEKIYRANWVGGTYMIQFDDECSLYFIERNNGDD